jgi:signal transduction histidine kinase
LAKETAERERLEQEMLDISEREQRRIGRDLHDSLCQHLTGTAVAGHVLAETLSSAGRSEAASARKIVGLVEEAVGLARGIAKGLLPVEMGAEGLMQALEEFASTTSEIFGIQCRFLCHAPVLIQTPAAATHLYRIAQEAVGNAIKHSHAHEISILLDESDSGIRLVISDDGDGFPDPLPDNGGMGLRIMADRAKMIGGRFIVERNPDHGMELSCLIPASKLDGTRD